MLKKFLWCGGGVVVQCDYSFRVERERESLTIYILSCIISSLTIQCIDWFFGKPSIKIIMPSELSCLISPPCLLLIDVLNFLLKQSFTKFVRILSQKGVFTWNTFPHITIWTQSNSMFLSLDKRLTSLL